MKRYDQIQEVRKARSFDEIRKFNQNHDAAGRFSSAPGGGAAKTVAEAKDYAKNTLGFKNVDYGTLDIDTINEINGTIAEVQKKYPETKGAVQTIKMSGRDDAFLSTMFYGETDTMELQIGSIYEDGIGAAKDIYQAGVDARYFPQGTDYKSAVWHEYGHVMEGLEVMKRYKGGDERNAAFDNHTVAKEWLDKATNDSAFPSKEALQRSISTQATMTESEAFCEAFSEYNCSKTPRAGATLMLRASGHRR